MDAAPLLTAAQPIPPHAFAALTALVLGAAQFALPKGTVPHRAIGYCYMALMTFVAVTGLFIHTIGLIGPFSPIHFLSLVTLVTLVQSVWATRTGRIAAHKSAMIQLYVLARLVAGAFTLMPGRIMHDVLFG